MQLGGKGGNRKAKTPPGTYQPSIGAPAEKNYQWRLEINRGFRVGKIMELILMPQQT